MVEASASRPSAILVVAAENTWQAYNNWGGRSLYAFNSANRPAATHVSFDRPYGVSAQTPFQWEYQAVRFLESRGYDVSYATDAEIDANPNELLRHRLVIVNGHNEYWTKAMRDGFDAARTAGTNLAFLGANDGYWQIRYENERRTIVEYRSAAFDPEPDRALKTTKFRWLDPPRPECSLLGVQFASADASSAPVPTDYAVDPASLGDPWFRGTGFAPTSTLPGLVGYEWDGIDPSCSTPPLTALFRATGPPDAAAVRYTAPEGARVFSAGSLQFSWGLDDWNAPGHADPRLQRFMANALDDLQRPAPPIALTAKRARGGVRVDVTLQRDPRVAGARIFAHTSGNPFVPVRPVGTCKARATACLLRLKLAGGRYRFAAETFDRWGASAPLFSLATRVELPRAADRRRRPPGSSRRPAPRARGSGG